MKSIRMSFAIAAGLLASIALADPPTTQPADDERPAAVSMVESMTPGDVHKLLAKMAGEWDVGVAGAPPSVKGESTIEPILGGRYVRETLSMDGPMPFEMVTTTGYSNLHQRTETSVRHTMATNVFNAYGTADLEAGTLTFVGDVDHPLMGTLRMLTVVAPGDGETMSIKTYLINTVNKPAAQTPEPRVEELVEVAKKGVPKDAQLYQHLKYTPKKGADDKAADENDRQSKKEGGTSFIGAGGGAPVREAWRDTPKGEVEYFGIKAKADRVVFLIDRSGSMYDTIDQVKSGMHSAIEKMEPTQSFHLVFFASGQPEEMIFDGRQPELVTATKENVRAAIDYLAAVQATGLTDPKPAIRSAFAVTNNAGQRADTIFLLTDGEFADDAVELIKKLNADKKTVVHTIGYLSDEGEANLRAIADFTGGEYREVTDRDLEGY